MPYSPLGRGFLTGTARPADQYDADDMRSRDPRWQPGNYERNVAATAELTRLAEAKGARCRSSHWPGCSAREPT